MEAGYDPNSPVASVSRTPTSVSPMLAGERLARLRTQSTRVSVSPGIKELREQLTEAKLRTQTAVNAGAFIAARLMETYDISKARLQSFVDSGRLMLDAAKKSGD